MANRESQFNPAYSTIKAIYLSDSEGSSQSTLNIARQNTECQFEKIEFVENVNDVFPNGVLVVRDTKDIVSRLRQYNVSKIVVEFFNSTRWDLDITSVSYINNAASDTEENFVGIYFSNKYYKLSQSTSLNKELYTLKPNVLILHELVDSIKRDYFKIPVTNGTLNDKGYSDQTSNYALYKPLNPVDGRDEIVSDNGIEYLNYLASAAVDKQTNNPSFLFWTEFDGNVNFKSFKYDLQQDSSFATIDNDFRRFAIYNGDAVVQPVSKDRNKLYRKIYFLNTDPAYQYISKNYYYIRKTPKVLDEIPQGLTTASQPNKPSDFDKYIYSSLAYQFQDEGQKYNIEIISNGISGGKYYIVPGANQIVYDKQWGYYDGPDPLNDKTSITHISQVFGSEKNYKELDLIGLTSYMPYVDNTEMWKNYFDMTPIHPNFPDGGTLAGKDTYLQKIINFRYDNFINGVSGAAKELEEIRKIELQNFVMYSLCCMGQANDDCFFALLEKYQEDNTKTITTPSKMYRYAWKKITFSENSGPSGATYIHQLENWKPEGLRSSINQDDTWAINLNERGLSSTYLPPGWEPSCIPSGFAYRPIGANEATVGNSGNINHIVKLCRYDDAGKYFYYFIAENVVDGCCP